jgi:hypothetical protein
VAQRKDRSDESGQQPQEPISRRKDGDNENCSPGDRQSASQPDKQGNSEPQSEYREEADDRQRQGQNGSAADSGQPIGQGRMTDNVKLKAESCEQQSQETDEAINEDERLRGEFFCRIPADLVRN